MSINRAAIFDALVARLGTVPGVQSVRTRLIPFENVTPKEQPALFVFPTEQSDVNAAPGMPPVWSLSYSLLVLVHDDSAAGPQRALQAVLDGIEAALVALPDEVQFPQARHHTTLGGLVRQVAITGLTTRGEVSGPQTIANIELEVVAA